MNIQFHPQFGFISIRCQNFFFQFLHPYFVLVKKNGFKFHFCADNKVTFIKGQSITFGLQILGFGFVADF